MKAKRNIFLLKKKSEREKKLPEIVRERERERGGEVVVELE